MNANATLTILIAATVSILTSRSVPSNAQGFSGLGSDAGNFAQVVRGRPLVFPADHGAHPNFRIEWWYLTANLRDAQGVGYGVQWTLFRQSMAPADRGEGWANQQIWMGHAAITSAKVHHFAERFARGGVWQAGLEVTPFRAWIDEWQMSSELVAPEHSFGPLRLKASAKEFSYDLRLETTRPPVLQGESGYSKKSERDQASYYYSQPYLLVSGSIVLDGKAIEVAGQAWFDHEWSSQPLASDQTGWDWISLHLDSGEKLMLFRLRHADGKHFFAGNWVTADGRSEVLDPRGIVMTPIKQTRVAGRDVPTEWKISIPSRQLGISSVPLNSESWMDTRFKYWEGPITVSGSHGGIGYLEMTGY